MMTFLNLFCNILILNNMEIFKVLYEKYMNDKQSYLNWDKIEQIDNNGFSDYNDLPEINENEINNISKQISVIKLNGGLGTTMGCTGPKSLMKIKNEYTFMDILLKQNSFYNIPFILMNSFYTDQTTKDYLKNISKEQLTNIYTFNQNCYPRIIKDTGEYFDIKTDNIDHLYPPGHGDLLQSFGNSNIIDKLISKGIKYVFISNSDNLGATLDFKILNDLIQSDTDFAIELTPKTLNDVKGGTLIKYENKYRMFEVAQCPPDKLSEFTSIDKFKYFNTNNIWIKLDSIKTLLKTYYIEDIDIIINNKKLKDGRECIQLEYAIGSMVKFFNNVKCYIVERNRFIPVKNNDDLDLVRSNAYSLNKKYWTLEKSN